MPAISTRTPEGEPARCVVCGAETLIVPSAFPTADAPCPACGTLLWLTADTHRAANGRDIIDEEIAAMEAAISKGAEWLRQLQRVRKMAPRGEPNRVELGLHEVTDPVEIRFLESHVAGGE